jgi:hypothetical protein
LKKRGEDKELKKGEENNREERLRENKKTAEVILI